MANMLETSFIPQQPLLQVNRETKSKKPMSVVLLVAYAVLFATIIATLGSYFYGFTLEKQVGQKRVQLASAEDSFKIEEINPYKGINDKLQVAKGLVDNHTIASTALDFLEVNTAKNVALTSFTFNTGSDQKSPVTISVSVIAPSYEAMYAQTEEWKKLKIVQNVVVSGATLDELSGLVNFGATFTIDASEFTITRALQSQKTSDGNEQNMITPPASVISPQP